MPRYFFNQADGEIEMDRLGRELAGPAEARAALIIYAARLVMEMGENFWNSTEWEAWVTDEDGAQVCAVTLRPSGSKLH